MAKTVLTLEGEDAKAMMAIQRVMAGQRKLAASGKKVTNETKKGERAADQFGKTWVSGLKNIALGFVGVSAGIATVKKLVALQREYNREASDTARHLDEMATALEKQAMTQDPALREAVYKTMSRFKVPGPRVFGTAREMISGGFKVEQLKAGALEEMIALEVAMNAKQSLGDPMTSYLDSQGLPLTKKSIREVGGRVFGLFAEKKLEAIDLPFIAKAGGKMRAAGEGVGIEHQLSLMTLLKQKGGLPGSEAATAMGNIVTKLATAEAEPRAAGALKLMGLKPEDVDFVGEELPEVLNLLGEALEKQHVHRRATILRAIGGLETMSALSVAIRERDLIGQYGAMQAEGEKKRRVATGFGITGHAATMRGWDVDLKIAQAKDIRAQRAEEERRGIEVTSIQQGQTPAARGFVLKAHDVMTWAGGQSPPSREEAAGVGWKAALGPVGWAWALKDAIDRLTEKVDRTPTRGQM